MSSKELFVVLGVLIVLFVFGVGLGATHSNHRATDSNPDWVAGLGEVLVPKKRLRIEDVDYIIPRDCLQDNMIVVSEGRPCTLTISDGAAPIRVLKLYLAQGGPVKIILEQEDRITVKKSLTGSEQEEFDVYQDGGTLIVQQVPSLNGAPVSRVEFR